VLEVLGQQVDTEFSHVPYDKAVIGLAPWDYRICWLITYHFIAFLQERSHPTIAWFHHYWKTPTDFLFLGSAEDFLFSLDAEVKIYIYRRPESTPGDEKARTTRVWREYYMDGCTEWGIPIGFCSALLVCLDKFGRGFLSYGWGPGVRLQWDSSEFEAS
jgi:hypothetical protein